jgi:hypothetical protein
VSSTGPVTARLAHQLRAQLRRLTTDGIWIECAEARHRLRFDDNGDDDRLVALDHDTDAEAVLEAVGGTPPLCLRIVDAVDDARPQDLWAALSAEHRGGRGRGPSGRRRTHDALEDVPATDLAVLLARSLDAEFVDASTVVRESVSQLGLSLLAPGFHVTPVIATKFQMTREFPRWDTGARRWSDKELVLLSRCLRVAKGERRPHLELLPADPIARRAVARYVVDLLDGHRLLSPADLRDAISPTFRNVRAVTSLLLSEGLLEAVGGGFRTTDR